MKITLRGRERNHGETVLVDCDLMPTKQTGIRQRISGPVMRSSDGIKVSFTTDVYSTGSTHKGTIVLSKAELIEFIRIAMV
jgi:hypothetical protein